MVGSLVLDRFLIERRIGSGGFGTVYEAWDGRLERPVAVKAIDSGGSTGSRPGAARGAGRGPPQPPGDRHPLRDGGGGRQRPARHRAGRGRDPRSASTARARSATARSARSAPISARPSTTPTRARSSTATSSLRTSSSPTDGEPRAKLMDFGVARVTDAAGLTAPGDVVGTLAYMAPEQAEGRVDVGPEADIYSLALMLYECLARREPEPARDSGGDRAGDRRPRPPPAPPPPRPASRADRDDRRVPAAAPVPPPEPGAAGRLDRGLAGATRRRRRRRHAHPLAARLGVAAAAAVLGVWLAAGHGVALP